jgi:hypothetical protein
MFLGGGVELGAHQIYRYQQSNMKWDLLGTISTIEL